MSAESDAEVAVQRELLRLALQNSKRSVPLQLVAVGVVVALGTGAGAILAALSAGLLGICVAAWRLSLARRYSSIDDLTVARIESAARELEGNSVLAGVLWVVCSIAIYPLLSGTQATTFVVIAIGSVATAALFMSLVGRAFYWLVGLTLGSVVASSLLFDSVRSWPLAVLVAFFGFTMLRASRAVSDATSRAIRHGMEEDLVNASLLQAKAAADAANVAKSQFLATMSHEIRTPMNGVLGSLDLLRHSTLDAHQRHLVNTAVSSGSSLMDILNDVLDHSTIEAGKLSLRPAPVSLHSLASSVVALFRANAEGKGLELQLVVQQGVDNWVVADAQRLKQVLLNLIGNAIKFTERGIVALIVRAEDAPPGHARVTFEVHDSGVGIPKEDMARLFQPFHQVAREREKRSGGGTGLGLAISQKIALAMNSRIEVESELGVGSRFYFTALFGLDDTVEHPVQVDSALGALDGDVTMRGRVLLVEDNEVNRMIAREVLLSLGLDVDEAENGVEALKCLENRKVDLVLLDCLMPIMDGYETAQEIRRRETVSNAGRMPIVALTANAFDADAYRSRAAGMDAHLAKPYTRSQLRDVLRHWL
ncbi:MAG TPA: ATP-binding protein [Caldimonas sp.]|jgi:signal transduction histidine kinase/CheY-like chemotaxis protein|nr:ATP-binding protein [Caldimonas sp.]HEX2539801.1 ATP-binding protein [Caldimonas sp.]